MKPETDFEIAAQCGVDFKKKTPKTDLEAYQQAESEAMYPKDRYKLGKYFRKEVQ